MSKTTGIGGIIAAALALGVLVWKRPSFLSITVKEAPAPMIPDPPGPDPVDPPPPPPPPPIETPEFPLPPGEWWVYVGPYKIRSLVWSSLVAMYGVPVPDSILAYANQFPWWVPEGSME